MLKPTKTQYQEAIPKLSNRQIEILQVLYHFPNSSATAIELAKALNYKGFQGANRHIGAIGEAIYKHTGVEPPTYIDRGERFAYFYFVGEYNERGWNMWPELKKALEHLELVTDNSSKNIYVDRLPTEIMPFEEKQFYKEGKITEVFVNRYERNQKARLACIQHYGAICQCCGFDYGVTYGSIAKGFIHVHHIVPLADIGKSYSVNPITDLIPLCANCHSVIHLSNPQFTLFDLKKN